MIGKIIPLHLWAVLFSASLKRLLHKWTQCTVCCHIISRSLVELALHCQGWEGALKSFFLFLFLKKKAKKEKKKLAVTSARTLQHFLGYGGTLFPCLEVPPLLAGLRCDKHILWAQKTHFWGGGAATGGIRDTLKYAAPRVAGVVGCFPDLSVASFIYFVLWSKIWRGASEDALLSRAFRILCWGD